jgi:hypothetical protein
MKESESNESSSSKLIAFVDFESGKAYVSDAEVQGGIMKSTIAAFRS